jgi:hypothetical protein
LTDVKTKIANSPLLKVYPNPAKDYVMYDAKELDIKRITITSIDGKITKDIIPGKNTKISIGDLPANVYILSVYTKKGEIYIQEFAKE